MKRAPLPLIVLIRSTPRCPAGVLGFILLASLAVVVSLGPVQQSQAYHDFADRRVLLGVANLFDVVSNLGFLIVGACGAASCLGARRPRAVASWTTVFIGTVMVSLGSAYYHMAPSDSTLVWDRLPMTLSFMALLVALVAELALFPARYTHRWFLACALGIYVLAKLTEYADRNVFELTGHSISGHTLKHLLAAGAIVCVLLMLRRRSPVAAP